MRGTGRNLIQLTYKSAFGNSKDSGIYSGMDDKVVHVEQGIWTILFKAGIYASALALLLAFGYMMWYCHQPENTKKAKEQVVRICGIIILIFGLTGIISLIQAAAL